MTLEEWFKTILAKYPRIALTGGPSVGKTTLSGIVADRPVFHSDDFKHYDWSQASAVMAAAVNLQPGPLVVEGVAVPRALRKGMLIDAVVLLRKPRMKQATGQISMTKGIFTVLEQWRLEHLDIPIISPPRGIA